MASVCSTHKPHGMGGPLCPYRLHKNMGKPQLVPPSVFPSAVCFFWGGERVPSWGVSGEPIIDKTMAVSNSLAPYSLHWPVIGKTIAASHSPFPYSLHRPLALAASPAISNSVSDAAACDKHSIDREQALAYILLSGLFTVLRVLLLEQPTGTSCRCMFLAHPGCTSVHLVG